MESKKIKPPKKPETLEQTIKKICKKYKLSKDYASLTIGYVGRVISAINSCSVEVPNYEPNLVYKPNDGDIGMLFEHPVHEDGIDFYVDNEHLTECMMWKFNDQFGFIEKPSDIDIVERVVMVCLAKDAEKDMTNKRIIHNQTNITLN